uniref:L,D-transpeptidase catalytic domain n=1 Tax=Candidatus Kentrum eta TaxID=2126337 RepID=A0A450UXQ8_9GAMM|nr:MAG: L,D-transpeptidase catalytic domain [Candidatus Kentron sp. H]VFJ90994.1 MAG: L,D-transpeptidase catalytic domain [Candidatus Kentron sp. H]VFJ97317.1 MAG: L,D-transpeptidase catalytic domain [Candidatus Kentron sp. H]
MMIWNDESLIRISIPEQRLTLVAQGLTVAEFPVSTGAKGPGERMGSGCTPRGWHRVRAKIGAGAPVNTVFRGRRPTGEIHGPGLAARYPERDWILTRILWLGGLEPGRNRFREVDTQRRFIYIHGCPAGSRMGVPLSHGCIRMRNADVMAVFDEAWPGMLVAIEGGAGWPLDDGIGNKPTKESP